MAQSNNKDAIFLCRPDEIPDGTARGFVFGGGIDRREVFVYRRGATLYGYDNACPHQGTPLNFLPDQFLDSEGAYFHCATHGAQFRIESGFCVLGPCRGKTLRAIRLRLTDGAVWWLPD
jgi:nitrite reductase/ring-hydroxylating ferredoxin subunit